FFQAEDGIRDGHVTGVQTCALPISLIIRLQLGGPNGHVVTAAQYNQIFTMHGTTMIFLVVMPLGAGLANFLVPLMIGARDVAFRSEERRVGKECGARWVPCRCKDKG